MPEILKDPFACWMAEALDSSSAYCPTGAGEVPQFNLEEVRAPRSGGWKGSRWNSRPCRG